MMIRSGVARQLVTQGARVTVISRTADEALFQQEPDRKDKLKARTWKWRPVSHTGLEPIDRISWTM